jgi:hypothetical protein
MKYWLLNGAIREDEKLALPFAQPVAPVEVEEPDDEEEFGGGYRGGITAGGWMR